MLICSMRERQMARKTCDDSLLLANGTLYSLGFLSSTDGLQISGSAQSLKIRSETSETQTGVFAWTIDHDRGVQFSGHKQAA